MEGRRFLICKLSRPKRELTEYQAGSRHHLAVQFSEFDITNFGIAFRIADILQSQPAENKKAESLLTLPFREKKDYLSVYFLNFFLPNPASPTSPAPKRSMVVGSGTGFPPA